MVIFLITLLHIIILVVGIKSFKGAKKKREGILFLLIILFSVYMGIAEAASLPIVPLLEGVQIFFEPIGRWIEQVLM